MGGDKDQGDRGCAQRGLHDARSGERMRQRVNGREKVDVKRRDIIKARSKPEVSAGDTLRQLDISGRIEPGSGLQEWVTIELEGHGELYRKNDEQQRR